MKTPKAYTKVTLTSLRRVNRWVKRHGLQYRGGFGISVTPDGRDHHGGTWEGAGTRLSVEILEHVRPGTPPTDRRVFIYR